MKWIKVMAANKQDAYHVNLSSVSKIHITTEGIQFYFRDKETPMSITSKTKTGAIEVTNEELDRIKGAVEALYKN